MGVFVEMARLRFLTLVAYRLNYYSGVLTYLVYIGGYDYLWRAIYGGRAAMAGVDIAALVTYLAVAWMTRAFTYNNLDEEIETEVRTGLVAVQLLRPYPYLVGKLWAAGGEGLFRACFWMVPGVAACVVVFGIRLPTDPLAWGLWLGSALLALAVSAEIGAAFGLVAFFLQNATGVRWARQRIIDLLSGVYLPLTFFPPAFQTVLNWLPFRDIIAVPAGVLLGTIGARALIGQLAWTLVLGLALALLWRRVRQTLMVQGG